MCRRLPTSFMSVGGMSQFVSQIPTIDAIFMGWWMEVQVSTMRSSVTFKNKLVMGDIDLRTIIMIPCEIFFRTHLSCISIISLIGSMRSIVDGHGGTL